MPLNGFEGEKEESMLSLEAAYDALVQAMTSSASQRHYQATTSLAPQLGFREMAPRKHQRAYERHDGGRSLLLTWRETASDIEHSHGQRQVLTIILLEEGQIVRRHTVEFES